MAGETPSTQEDNVDRIRWDGVTPKTGRRTELTPDQWWSEIKLGLEFRKNEGRSDRWEDLRRYYKNDFPEEVMVYNLIYMAVEDLRSLLVARAPGVTITAEDAQLEQFAPILEAIDNKLIRIMRLRKQLRETTTDSVLYGLRALKIGYDSQYGYFPEVDLERPQDEIEGDATITAFGKRGEWLEYTEEVNPGMPWVQRVSPWMIVFPNGTASLRTARWVAHNIWRPLEDVQADTKYKNTANLEKYAKELRSTTSRRGDVAPQDQQNPLIGVPRGVKVLSLWEIRDVKTGMVYVICEGYPRFLRQGIDRLQQVMNGLPYTAFAPHADPDCIWGLSDAMYLYGLQMEMNKARSQYRDSREVAVPKVLIEEGSMTDTQVTNFLSGKFRGVAFYKRGTNQPIVFNPDISKADLPLYIRSLIQEARDTLGLPRIMSGAESGPPRKTAEEVGYLMAGANIKPDLRREAVSEMVVETMRKVNDMLFKFWDEERDVQVMGAGGAREWASFIASDMAGRYMVEVRADTMAPVDRQTRMQAAILLSNMYQQDPVVDPVKLRRKVFSEFPGYDPAEMVPERGPGMGAGPMGGVPAE